MAVIPTSLLHVKARAAKAIEPLRPSSIPCQIYGSRTDAGRQLPPYYLVYFLLVELLGFPNEGQEEKVAWSVPVEMDGKVFVVAHRKLGVGVFAQNVSTDEPSATKIVEAIHRGIKEAEPFFRWMADMAVKRSALNVTNNGASLYDRFDFLRKCALGKFREAKDRKNDHVTTELPGGAIRHSFPLFELAREAHWFALAAIEAFFSWTEHIFIHIAILQGKITTGEQVADLADKDWPTKYKTALDAADPEATTYFDKLILIRRQLRNFIAHGSFGKRGEAFHFHSGAGAVPLLLTEETRPGRYAFTAEPDFDDNAAIEVIDKFIAYLWSGPRRPAFLYIQKSGLHMILPHASDGIYKRAMSSTQEMDELVEYLVGESDRSADMDW